MRRGKAPAQAAPRCTVTVCRGCCCGTAKVPGTDHAAQLAVHKAELGAIAQVRAVNCLDACEQADVIVVKPSSPGRAAGGRPVWLRLVNDPGATGDIVVWVRSGGPGLADPPDILDL
ncbi:(2Fe-2S) ferredoxin domain-containing protein [Streptomyces sp. NPDC096538]|uniref:(2Fe-2S) ferredoxin domain-containing protein n=1 Tax=Streptomyces sp. NPDC096538 TaxID=3155427 RepID=UPI003321D132